MRKALLTTLGGLLLLGGIVLLPLPGPGSLLIIAGLAVLARVFPWADRLKRNVVVRLRHERAKMRARKPRPTPPHEDEPHGEMTSKIA